MHHFLWSFFIIKNFPLESCCQGRGTGSVPSQGTKMPHDTRPKRNKHRLKIKETTLIYTTFSNLLYPILLLFHNLKKKEKKTSKALLWIMTKLKIREHWLWSWIHMFWPFQPQALRIAFYFSDMKSSEHYFSSN